MDMKDFSLTKHDPDLTELIAIAPHKVLAQWAIMCIERVMPIFEKKYPDVDIPRTAINLLKNWIQNKISMWDARKFCFEVLKLAKEFEKTDIVASKIIRGCSHTLATCHVPSHSEGSAMYVISALKELNKNNPQCVNIMQNERDWQIEQLENLIKSVN